MADELLNAQDLIAAKKHDTFHSEVVTGKVGGLSTGANIDYATNAVTGQVQKTLPKILDDLDWSYVGLFADGVTFTDKTDFAVDAVGTQWIYTGSLPFSATAGTVPSEPTYQVVHVKSASAISNANGGSVQDFIDANTFKTVADMKAFTNHVVGSKVFWQGYYSQSDGGGNWGVVKSGAHTPDGGSVFSIDENTYIQANLKGGKISILKFGARGDGGITSRETNSLAVEAAIAYMDAARQTKLYVPAGDVGSKLYTMQRPISLKAGMTLFGDGMRESFLNFPAGVNGVVLSSDCKLKDIGLEAVLDNTKLQNGITVVGDTDSRPYRVFISRVYVGNFYRVAETNWMWASVIKSVHSINSGRGIQAKGVTVNNVLKSCQLAGRDVSNDDAAVLIGDGINATEGWMITQNLTFGFGIGLRLNKCSHCAMSNNIWDFCYKHGVLYSDVSINNKIVNDYIGMSDGAVTGYYANQNADHQQSKGNKISQCDIVAYGTLQAGLRLSQYEHNARVDKVSVDSCSIASIAVEGSPRNVRVTGCNFESDNATFGNNGQVRDSLVYWNGNTGGIVSSYVTIKFDDGLSVARYVSNTPSNGNYIVGDTAINRGETNATTYKWVCTVAGTAGAGAVFKQVNYV